MSAFQSSAADDLLASLGFARFSWCVASDNIVWHSASPALLAGMPQSGALLAQRIELSPSVRNDMILHAGASDPGDGVAYRVEYALRLESSTEPVWVEEIGRWFADAAGRPCRAEAVLHVIGERRARDEALMKLSQSDPHTGELNRTRLFEAVAEALDDSARFRSSFAFLLIAIDDLAHINDSFGFDIADEVIHEFARRLRARLRGGDALGRISGNRFGILLKNCSADDMGVAAERFLSCMRDEIVATRLGPVAATASIGGVNAPRHARTVEDTISRAQEALDLTRRRRRDGFAAWQPSAARDAQRRVNIRVTDEIVSALNDRRLTLAFEPIVGATTGVAAFHECLVRIRQGEDVIAASDIVPVAEKLGLIRLVDHRVLQLVFDELAASPQAQLSLNISPDTTGDPDWWAHVESSLRACPGIAERLIVEITETVAIRDVDEVQRFVTRLKDFGCRIAIDDFGAGHTSFRNLRRLGVDIVKIDGAFVQNMARSADDRAFVHTLIDLARRLDLKTVAEWVQDEESATLLRGFGCDYLQGRLIGLAESRAPWRDHDAAGAVAAAAVR